MTELRRRMLEDMELHGLAPNTQDCYVNAVKRLAQYYGRSPDRLTEGEIRGFFLYLINEKEAGESTVKLHLYGIKFLYEKTLGREWPVLRLVRPRRRRKLPVVLSPEEVRRLLAQVRQATQRTSLTTIYSCGLRLSEGTHLHVDDIDSGRMMLTVRNAKGGRDRNVPLPQRTLELLRAYWRAERSQFWLFPAKNAPSHMPNTTLQKTFKAVLRESGVRKDASIHTLRHSYATHLMENGVPLRVIQEILGHKSPRTTAIYTHLTQRTVEGLQATVNRLMADL
jgi:integrase/recombinase XerD